jgi:hypothetical protein
MEHMAMPHGVQFDATHDLFRADEANVLLAMRAFIDSLPVRAMTPP